MSSAKLRECRWCGAEDAEVRNVGGYQSPPDQAVKCVACGAQGPTALWTEGVGEQGTKRVAADLWNHRPPHPAEERVRELSALVKQAYLEGFYQGRSDGLCQAPPAGERWWLTSNAVEALTPRSEAPDGERADG